MAVISGYSQALSSRAEERRQEGDSPRDWGCQRDRETNGNKIRGTGSVGNPSDPSKDLTSFSFSLFYLISGCPLGFEQRR